MIFRNPPSALAHSLLLVAVVWFLMGLGILVGVSGTPVGAFHVLMPLWLRVATWWVPAAVALWCMVRKGEHGGLAVALLMVAPVIRVASYGLAWLIYLANTPPLAPLVDLLPEAMETPGHPGGWYGALIHLGHIGVVITVALLIREDRAAKGLL